MTDKELYHYGVLGMRWGKRKDQSGGSSRKSKKGTEQHEDYKKAHSSKSYKSMSNQELRDANNRLQMESQYKNLTKKTGMGKKVVDTFVATAGIITAVSGAYKVYQKTGNQILNKIGNAVVKNLKFTNLHG